MRVLTTMRVGIGPLLCGLTLITILNCNDDDSSTGGVRQGIWTHVTFDSVVVNVVASSETNVTTPVHDMKETSGGVESGPDAKDTLYGAHSDLTLGLSLDGTDTARITATSYYDGDSVQYPHVTADSGIWYTGELGAVALTSLTGTPHLGHYSVGSGSTMVAVYFTTNCVNLDKCKIELTSSVVFYTNDGYAGWRLWHWDDAGAHWEIDTTLAFSQVGSGYETYADTLDYGLTSSLIDRYRLELIVVARERKDGAQPGYADVSDSRLQFQLWVRQYDPDPDSSLAQLPMSTKTDLNGGMSTRRL